MAKEKKVVKLTADNGETTTFAILDRLADIESLLDTKPASSDDMGYNHAETKYNALKEQIFESFYTSSDIEEIIVDSEHRHHDLVLRLYSEFMEEVSFLPFDNIEQEQEDTEAYYHFDDSKNIQNIEKAVYTSAHVQDGDLSEQEREPVSRLHTALTEAEMYRLQNKIESLIALLNDAEETQEFSIDMLEYFLQARSLAFYQSRLGYIMDGYALKKENFIRKLDKIEENIQSAMDSLQKKGASDDQVFSDRKVLKLHRKGGKIKDKWLSTMHDTFRELDGIHEKLYSFYHHLIEHAKLN